jgi:hypothetical protein
MLNFFHNLLNGLNFTSEKGFIIIIIIYGNNTERFRSIRGPKNCLYLLKKSDVEDVVGFKIDLTRYKLQNK